MKRQEEEESPEYRLMEELERLESLREDMEELGVKSLKDLEERIAQLNSELDALERESR